MRKQVLKMTGQPEPIQALPENFKPPSVTTRTEVLPGFKVTLGITLFFLTLIVIIPLSALVARPWENGWAGFQSVLTDGRVLHALGLSFATALAAAVVNTVAGLLVAWTLVRYRFPGKRLFDALVDLPFALPTAVAGVALSALYAEHGWIGGLVAPLGIKIAYTPLGIFMALVFIGLPFVVRSVQPVLAEFEAEIEEAAETLGASAWQRAWKVVFPALAPALVTGFSLALARGVGEYGSVIFIAGNMPYVSEIAPLLIVIKLSEFDYAGAASVGVIMLALSLGVLFSLNLVQRLLASRGEA